MTTAGKGKAQEIVSNADLFDPTDLTEVRVSHAKLKEWALSGQFAALNLSKQAKLDSDKEMLGAVEARFKSLYNAAIEGKQAADTLYEAFAEWNGNEGWKAWPLFEAKQTEVSKKAKQAQAKKGAAAAAVAAADSARSSAVTLRKGFSGGPNKLVGTVCAGLAEVNGGTWTGTSGHTDTLHKVMTALLNGVQQVEAWEVQNCGEVQAMNKYLNAKNAQAAKDIPKGLYSHAETWKWPKDGSGRNGYWIGRGACANCKQWLDKIGANYC